MRRVESVGGPHGTDVNHDSVYVTWKTPASTANANIGRKWYSRQVSRHPLINVSFVQLLPASETK